MNSFKTMLALVLGLGVVLLLQTGCEGPEGPAGKDGTNASIDLEGFAPGIKCATCHDANADTVYYVAGRVYQFETSIHFMGGAVERNSATCSGCHSTEGFIERGRGGFQTQMASEILNPSPPGCFACHSPHARADFSLRTQAPVTITSYIEGVPNAMFNYGKGNLCLQCHQTRTTSPMSPKPDPTKTAVTDTIVITSNRWYPHYGVNGQMLMGTGGFQFVGYNYTGNSNHTANLAIEQEGCIACHMAEPTGTQSGKGGGHTFKVGYEFEGTTGTVLTGCRDAGCHGASFSSVNYAGATTAPVGAQTAINANLDTLKQLLVARGWLNATTELLVASSSNPLRIAPAAKAGAIYNFYFIEHEGSHGVHNTKYAYELLRSSIAELRAP
ncbi:MAG TPA: hypothetical protein VGB89_10855 [Bacteroidota bacterium]